MSALDSWFETVPFGEFFSGPPVKPEALSVDGGGRRESASVGGAAISVGQRHPAANRLRKHEKSATFRTGAVVDPSQFAEVSPAAKRLRKQEKSAMFSTGAVVEPSQ